MIRLYCERIKFRSSKKPHAYFPFTGKNSSPPKPISTVAQLQTGKGNSDRSTIVAIRTQNEVMTQKPTIFSHWLKPHKTHGKFPWKRNLPFSGFSLIFSGSINRFGGEPQSFTGRSNLDRSVGQTLPPTVQPEWNFPRLIEANGTWRSNRTSVAILQWTMSVEPGGSPLRQHPFLALRVASISWKFMKLGVNPMFFVIDHSKANEKVLSSQFVFGGFCQFSWTYFFLAT